MQLGWRGVCAGFMIPALVAVGIGPAVHAHEANAHRTHTVIHRHMHSHGDLRQPVGVAHASVSAGGNISDHDNDAVWMNIRSVERSKIAVDIGSVVLAETCVTATAPEALGAAIPRDDSLPHGPPEASSTSRAPPTPSV